MDNSSVLMKDRGLTHLAALLGNEYVRQDADHLRVFPENQQQVAEILRFASAQKLVVTPVGSGTKQGWGNQVRADLLLSLSRMNKLREHAWQDMTCTVEAGARWADVQNELCKHGQMMGLDPLWPERATVGGILATNDGGSLRHKFGGLRDLIVGMTVVLADGTIAKTGGKVVKNVAGYDLHKLMTGSFGTLAVIVEVNFRLHPTEQNARTWTLRVPDGQLADSATFAAPLRALLDTQMTPTSIQLRTSGQESALDIRVASLPACLDECAVHLRKIAGPNPMVESNIDVWRARERLFDRKEAVMLKVSIPTSEICALSAEAQRFGPEVASVAQANGLMTIAIAGDTEQSIEFISWLRDRVRPVQGSVVIQRLPEAVRARVDVWGAVSNPLPLMQEIKRRFDPDRTLNPGRFVGNI